MKNILEYRENNYFNSADLFLLDNNLERTYISKVHLYNGNWYSDEGLKLKMTSVRCINCNDLYHTTVKYTDTEVEGVITKFLTPNSIGINWQGGKSIKKYGLPNFWNNPLNLDL